MQVNKKIFQFGLNIWVFYTPICFQSVIFNTIEQFSTECRKTSGIALVFLLNSFLWLVEKTRAILSTNQILNYKQSWVSYSFSLATYNV